MFTLLHHARRRAAFAAAGSAAPRSAFRRAAGFTGRTLLDAAVLGGGYAYYQHEIARDPSFRETMKGVARPAHFWVRVFPVYAHYRLVEFKLNRTGASPKDRDAAFDVLHDKYAPIALSIILELGGLYIKLGQVGATRADIMPPQYRAAFATLLDNVPALTGDEVRALASEALGKPLDAVFSEFGDTPLGAASIGQAHLARLADDGREVVVKVAYPDAAARFDLDFATAAKFVALAQPEQLPFLKEMRAQFATEFDFAREAWALTTVRENLERAGVARKFRVTIPRVVGEHSNARILVMERLPGTKLVDAVLDHYADVARAMGMSLEELMGAGAAAASRKRSDMVAGTAPAEQHTPSRWSLVRGTLHMYLNQYLGWYAAWAWNHTAGLASPKLAVAYPFVAPPLDGDELLRTLFAVHGHQLLVDGLFNGDPHPGNILLSRSPRDGHPEIGLIDYGQVKALSRSHRRHLARLIVALADEDRAAVLAAMRAASLRSEKGDPDTLYRTGVMFLASDENDMGINVQQYSEILAARDPMVAVPDWIVIALRMTLLLRGLGTLLAPHAPVNSAKLWRPIAERVLAEIGDEEGDGEDEHAVVVPPHY
ncbi:hypothetical protein H9P43_003897 [Blastocladiella emersonii ATCC 22665]|nr:hypothetical protein H9P43_003897 [Blastocladiella emersonii ATCC 22665]